MTTFVAVVRLGDLYGVDLALYGPFEKGTDAAWFQSNYPWCF